MSSVLDAVPRCPSVCPSPEYVERKGGGGRTIVDDELRLADGERTGRLVQSAPGRASGRARAAAPSETQTEPTGGKSIGSGKVAEEGGGEKKVWVQMHLMLQGRFGTPDGRGPPIFSDSINEATRISKVESRNPKAEVCTGLSDRSCSPDASSPAFSTGPRCKTPPATGHDLYDDTHSS